MCIHSENVSAVSQTQILIVGPSWVGDMMMAQSLFKILKGEHPNVHIDVLAPKWSEGLLQRMPEVRRIIPHTIEHGQLAWQERYRLGLALRCRGHDSQAYQQSIVLPNSWKSALIPYIAQIPRRTGYRGEMRYGLLNDIRKLDKIKGTVDQFVALGLPKNTGQSPPQPRLKPRPVPEEKLKKILQRLNIVSQTQILALCPGAEYGPAKCWPLEYYVTCAKQKISEGWDVWIFGSHKDQAIGARIQSLAGNRCFNLCGQTSLPEAVDLLSYVQAVITNDSGLMHVAAALDKPLIALFGSTSPDMTPPLSNQAHILYLGLKCSPCYQRTCPKKHLKCLRDIKPAQVLDRIKIFKTSTTNL